MTEQRIGLGFDIHRLEALEGEAQGSIPLAGLAVPAPFRVVAHSDGDVVLHALCDALLGAVAAGDIGEHFPDTDPAYAGCASADLLEAVLRLPQLVGWHLVNIDVNIIAQAPRLQPHRLAMRQRLAALSHMHIDRVSIKARSHEGLDAIGEKRGIAAQVIVLLNAHTSN